jgi:hypothetical protein
MSRRPVIGTRRVVLILRSKPVVTGGLLDIRRFANGSKLTSVAGVITTSADGDGERYIVVVGVGEKFINVAGDGASSTSADGGGENSMSVVGDGENSTFVVGDGVRFMSVGGDKPMFVGGPIVVTSSGANGVTTVGGTIDTNVGGSKCMSTSAGGRHATYMSVGGN